MIRWVKELTLALRHFTRPSDMLLDLRGLYIAPECGPLCCRMFDELLELNALSVAYYGASPRTIAMIGTCLRTHGDQPEGIRSRSPALAQLIQSRRERLGLLPMPHLPRDFLAGGNGWDESGAAFI